MARIVCFSDSAALVRAVRLGLSGREHAIYPLPCSRLTDDLRRTVRQLAPDVILLELSHALDNPHLFIFLRADAATRNVPIVVLSPSPQTDLYAGALGADAFLCSPFTAEQIDRTIQLYLPLPAPVGLPPLHQPAPAAEAAQPARHAPRPARAAEPRLPSIPALIPAMALAS